MKFLRCRHSELNLGVTLLNGQSFRWKKHSLEDGDLRHFFIGTAKHKVWKIWRHDDETVAYEILARFPGSSVNDEEDFKKYFQLDVDLSRLYESWINDDGDFKKMINTCNEQFSGIRILAQDPFETVLSFICSSNNNIQRISKMVEKLCEIYGQQVVAHKKPSLEYHFDFADLNRMANDDDLENRLKKNGFGYRAAYIMLSVHKLQKLGGLNWLENLKNLNYEQMKQALQLLPGVGPKVADCICLMAFQKHHVVPIDTHVMKLTTELFLPHLKSVKSLNKKVQKEIEEVWCDRFGVYAGWAHTVLFSTQLSHLSSGKKLKKNRKRKAE